MLSFADKLCLHADGFLRTVLNVHNEMTRKNPAGDTPEIEMSEQDRRHAAGLMRVNHTGEVCAQALYHGQSVTAKLANVREQMQHAQQEEVDHLVWCQQRLAELNSQPSYLNTLWYIGSFMIGAAAGAVGDKWSLGFVAETEKQVVAHLDKHLGELPAEDARSRKILKQMQSDEQAHQELAKQAGGAELPAAIRWLMKHTSKVMTQTAYWL
ncbi:MAG: demethoxyubiquinone hydroxylase family protein [Gammaproteobacteria bacterium CG11_big_fil_rev_8_21_14_0_20_46_22]|nr:MAG: demethoxyubiquinone hydroxylase family protein [Gammaproteobacteria bacterium CG12_big_fil_rev_8_21_14_0_65_46_12]PIR11968.1 MAG: demethoxyubiquinone hydroxylase family protein [Gammaproteobacteria bacterium CG11_big_fil_rev_8_21_14_0_20_46_22]